jgi:hypothetical protein
MDMLTSILTYSVVFFGVLAIASFVNHMQKKSRDSNETLGPIYDDRFCEGLHDWSQAIFITKDQYAEIKAKNLDVSNSPQHDYCRKCGYVPSLRKMVRPKALGMLLAQEFENKNRLQDLQDLGELKEDFFRRAMEYPGCASKNHADVRFGYDLHDGFVTVLPQLLADKRMKRLLKEQDKK